MDLDCHFALLYTTQRGNSHGIFAIVPANSEVEATFMLETWLNASLQVKDRTLKPIGFRTFDNDNELLFINQQDNMNNFIVMPLKEYIEFYLLKEDTTNADDGEKMSELQKGNHRS